MKETDITRAIIAEHHEKLMNHLENDVVIVGGGPAGMTAAYYLAKEGIKTIILEKRLAIGGGIWGGAAGYGMVVTEETDIIEEMGMRYKQVGDLFVVDSCEFSLCLGERAIHAGAAFFNLTYFEDVVIRDDRVVGVVVNGTAIHLGQLHVDPYCIIAKYVLDGSGHPAEVISMMQKKGVEMPGVKLGEGPMQVDVSERDVVEKTGEFYPGVFLAGMSVCTCYNIPRMGPIFGGMLKSGKKAAEMIIEKLG